MFVDLNRKVDFNSTPYETKDKFSIYAISEKGVKQYVDGNHFTHHYLNKYPKEVLDMINNDVNGYKLEEAEQWEVQMERERQKKEKKAKEEDKKEKKKVEFNSSKNEERSYNNKKSLNQIKKKGNNKINVYDDDRLGNKNLTQPFKTYSKGIEKAAKFSSSVTDMNKIMKGMQSRINTKIVTSK